MVMSSAEVERSTREYLSGLVGRVDLAGEAGAVGSLATDRSVRVFHDRVAATGGVASEMHVGGAAAAVRGADEALGGAGPLLGAGRRGAALRCRATDESGRGRGDESERE